MQNGVGRAQDKIHGVVVDLDDLRVGGNVGQQVRALGANAVGGKNHVVGGEGIAIVKLDTLAQMEAPAGRLRCFPALCQRRDDIQVLVARDQAFVNVSEIPVGGALIESVGT